ncbi:unnamed protein product [Candida verbasci]|uniref:Replication termination factor 2 n=1 Tax=Candida verbasci TaxID=1227364 RepID=A0A9W4TVH3_9ASCO|nr:unnamed protein product [Candida verbasci]
MGADGGTIAKRQDILALHSNFKDLENTKAKKGDGDEINNRFTICQISSLTLFKKDPIVGDYKGNLFIKEKILEYLLNVKLKKVKKEEKFNHISSIKDLCQINITWSVVKDVPFVICPVTKEIQKYQTFAYLRSCHCVLSYKVLKIKNSKDSDSEIKYSCPNCNKDYELIDIVLLDPLEKEESKLINDKKYEFLIDEGLTNSKLPKTKSKKDEKKKGDEIPKVDEFIRKRKLIDDDSSIDLHKKIKS